MNNNSYPPLSAFGRDGKCRTFRKSRNSLGSSSFSKMTAWESRKQNWKIKFARQSIKWTISKSRNHPSKFLPAAFSTTNMRRGPCFTHQELRPTHTLFRGSKRSTFSILLPIHHYGVSTIWLLTRGQDSGVPSRHSACLPGDSNPEWVFKRPGDINNTAII